MRMVTTFLLLFIATGCFIGPVLAQAPVAGAAPPATLAPAMPASAGGAFAQSLQPGDTVNVVVAGEPQITGQYTVRQDGRILFPLAGPMQVSGLTSMQVADQLSASLQKYVRRPVVSVDVVSAQPRLATLLGDVPRPGTYDLRQAPTLRALLAVAGELNPTADVQSAVLVREGEVAALLKPDQGQLPDLRLHAGDVITIPSRSTVLVHVLGAVRTPASYPLSSAGSAGRALLLAGSPTPEGDPAAAYIMRGEQRVPVNLAPFMDPRGNPPADTPLQPGDIVVVPVREQAYVYVLGEVRTPGAIPVTTADTITAALARAGGTNATANLAGAYILRNNTRVPVNLQALLQEGAAGDNAGIQPGDVLVVPASGGTVYWVGQVTRPGPVPYQQAETLLAAWASAGGVSPDGDLRNAMVLRENAALPVDLEALERGDMRQNLPLQPGDRILVPRFAHQMYILGQVGTPGVHNIHPGDTLLDVLARAGGPAGDAAINKIAIVRKLPPTQVEAERARLAAQKNGDRLTEAKLQEAIDRGLAVRFLDLARAETDAEVYRAQPGDLIYVPARREPRISWLDLLITVGTALLINN